MGDRVTDWSRMDILALWHHLLFELNSVETVQGLQPLVAMMVTPMTVMDVAQLVPSKLGLPDLAEVLRRKIHVWRHVEMGLIINKMNAKMVISLTVMVVVVPVSMRHVMNEQAERLLQ